jgi:hypothetical protein
MVKVGAEEGCVAAVLVLVVRRQSRSDERDGLD